MPDGTPLIAACSGGADSVALVHALAAASPRWQLAAVVFVDHGLHPAALECDAARAAADAVHAPFAVLTVAVARRGNLQANARAARYAALTAFATSVGGPAARIATGHTQTDRAETVLQRIIRGTGIAGLVVLAPARGQLVRPLLDVARATTRALGHAFADDPTNATDRFLRNRLRTNLFPLLAQENPRIEEALCALADAARDQQALLRTLGAGDAATGGRALGHLPEAALRAHLHALARSQGGSAPPRRAALQKLAHALATGVPSASVALGNGFRALARRGRVTFLPDDDPRKAVVVWGPGHYRLAADSVLEVLHVVGNGAGADDHLTARLPVAACRWPIMARREAHEVPTPHPASCPYWQVTDGDGGLILKACAVPVSVPDPLPPHPAESEPRPLPAEGNAWILVRLVFRQSGLVEDS